MSISWIPGQDQGQAQCPCLCKPAGFVKRFQQWFLTGWALPTPVPLRYFLGMTSLYCRVVYKAVILPTVKLNSSAFKNEKVCVGLLYRLVESVDSIN